MDIKSFIQKKEDIKSLCHDLKNIDINHVHDLLVKTTWGTTARILGFDIKEYDNLQLAGRMIIHDLKITLGTSIDNYINRIGHLLNPDILEFMKNYKDQLELFILSRQHNDINYDWFSANSLIKVYLTKIINNKNNTPYYATDDGNICETPVQLWLRISIALYWKHGLDEIKIVFNQLCDGYYIPASPTIFNAGMKRGQMSSCFLLSIDDNINSIYDKLKEQAFISKGNGAVGLDMSLLRHSTIGPDGKSSGIFPWVHLYNSSTRAVNQNGKRKGASTIYLRPYHIDIYEFCEGALKSGDSYWRAHDVNYAIWFPWLFWKRLENNDTWSLFCPAQTKKLNDIWGIEWAEQYKKYESDVTVERKTVNARHLMNHIINIQRKTGMPYILHGDAANMKSNQKNLGYIRCANLCLEIMEFSSSNETPSCNLSSISLRSFVKNKVRCILDKPLSYYRQELKQCYDFNTLGNISTQVVTNLNQVIEENRYIIDTIKRSNDMHRPIGIGVSGFAETLHELNLPFQDIKSYNNIHPYTCELNKMIFACMYWNTLAQSVNLAIERGKYFSFDGSPISQGKFQFDLWKDEYILLSTNNMIDTRIRTITDDTEINPGEWGQHEFILSNGHIIKPTWDDLRKAIKIFGLRNSLLIALMPTATSSQPLRNGETVEAHQSNIYSRKVMKGAYPVVNRYMVQDLQSIGVWNNTTIGLIQANKGSIALLPSYLKENINKYVKFVDNEKSWTSLRWFCQKYKTMWELSMKIFLKMAADRGRYVCQSQSTNIYLDDPSDEQLIAIHVYAQKLGLKTGMYYLRERAAVDPIKFTVEPSIIKFVNDMDILPSHNTINDDNITLTIKPKIICNDDVCISCQ